MSNLKLTLKVVEKDGRGVYTLEHRNGTVYLTRACFADGKMPESITLVAAGLVEDKPVPEADKRASQIARLQAQLAKLQAAPVVPTSVALGTVTAPNAAPSLDQQVAVSLQAIPPKKTTRKGRRAA